MLPSAQRLRGRGQQHQQQRRQQQPAAHHGPPPATLNRGKNQPTTRHIAQHCKGCAAVVASGVRSSTFTLSFKRNTSHFSYVFLLCTSHTYIITPTSFVDCPSHRPTSKFLSYGPHSLNETQPSRFLCNITLFKATRHTHQFCRLSLPQANIQVSQLRYNQHTGRLRLTTACWFGIGCCCF